MGHSRASKDQMDDDGCVDKNKYRHQHKGGENVSNDHWIEDAHIHRGELHRALGVPQGKKIPESRLEKAEHSKNSHMRKMANFAENVRR
jgi:hypothetical protein